jgi:hypothetical protein
MPLRFKRFERVRSHFAYRFTRLGVSIFAMALAVAIVTTLTVDLGPSLRGIAEREGSCRIERPMHIGSLSIRPFNGQFVPEDFVIEGLTHRPSVPSRETPGSVALLAGNAASRSAADPIVMTDWRIVVSRAGGRHV